MPGLGEPLVVEVAAEEAGFGVCRPEDLGRSGMPNSLRTSSEDCCLPVEFEGLGLPPWLELSPSRPSNEARSSSSVGRPCLDIVIAGVSIAFGLMLGFFSVAQRALLFTAENSNSIPRRKETSLALNLH